MKCAKWKLGSTRDETIRLTLESLGMDVEEFAMRALLPISQFERVVAGAAPITIDIIEGMERVVSEPWPYSPEDGWDTPDDRDDLDDWDDEC